MKRTDESGQQSVMKKSWFACDVGQLLNWNVATRGQWSLAWVSTTEISKHMNPGKSPGIQM